MSRSENTPSDRTEPCRPNQTKQSSLIRVFIGSNTNVLQGIRERMRSVVVPSSRCACQAPHRRVRTRETHVTLATQFTRTKSFGDDTRAGAFGTLWLRWRVGPLFGQMLDQELHVVPGARQLSFHVGDVEIVVAVETGQLALHRVYLPCARLGVPGTRRRGDPCPVNSGRVLHGLRVYRLVGDSCGKMCAIAIGRTYAVKHSLGRAMIAACARTLQPLTCLAGIVAPALALARSM